MDKRRLLFNLVQGLIAVLFSSRGVTPQSLNDVLEDDSGKIHDATLEAVRANAVYHQLTDARNTMNVLSSRSSITCARYYSHAMCPFSSGRFETIVGNTKQYSPFFESVLSPGYLSSTTFWISSCIRSMPVACCSNVTYNSPVLTNRRIDTASHDLRSTVRSTTADSDPLDTLNPPSPSTR
ncbi:hypothetical protein pipiens_005440 [Culex pipiens pipiens]|uniref:Uncharacterized protein n=1 Tax=Culex pipiens pipiens TaxID=38569 RepID=A0ABD1DWU0_CULPP